MISVFIFLIFYQGKDPAQDFFRRGRVSRDFYIYRQDFVDSAKYGIRALINPSITGIISDCDHEFGKGHAYIQQDSG